MTAKATIGGLLGPGARTRKPRKRRKERRQYKGTVKDGVLTLERGCGVTTIDTDGTPVSENVWDAKLRLFVNIGDALIVSRSVDDTFAVKVVGITLRGFVEDLRLAPIVPDGTYRVMKGPKA